MAFNRKITLTKRNHVYFGPTQSKKLSSSLEETYVDLSSIYDEFNIYKEALDSFVSDYLGDEGIIRTISTEITDMEKAVEQMIYIKATQRPIT